MRWYKSASYSTDLAMLRDYIYAGLDPYDFSEFLDEYFEQSGGYPSGYVDADQYMDEMSDEEIAGFKKWLVDHDVPSRIMQDALSPSYLHMEPQGLVAPDTWLVHFSDAAEDIAREGLQVGHEDMTTLGLTTYFTSKSKKPGWNFGFVANSRDADQAARSGKYGRHAVMLRAAGLKAYHYGDEENQVIFRGPHVREVIPLHNDRQGYWSVESTRDERELFKGEFHDVVAWVMDNYDQYSKVITRHV